MSVLLNQLDRRLAKRGQPIELRRLSGSGPTTTYVAVTVPAIIKASTVEEFTGTLVQQYFIVVISPTDLIRTAWVGAAQQVMVSMGDKAVIYGSTRNVERVAPFFEGSKCVRIDLVVKG